MKKKPRKKDIKEYKVKKVKHSNRQKISKVSGIGPKHQRMRAVTSGSNPDQHKKHTVTGVFAGNPRGFGFVTPDPEYSSNLGDRDIYIPPDYVDNAMHNDHVEVRLLPYSDSGRPEGSIINVLKRGKTELVGIFTRRKNGGFVFPTDPRYFKVISVGREDLNGARDLDKVIVRITNYGTKWDGPRGRITDIIGHEGEPGADILSIAMAMDIPLEFPDRVMRQAERTSDHVIPEDLNGREDLRDWKMVTIDGPYAKDLDDAVSLTKTDKGYTLGVHIADVSNYVQENSAMDREALKRGTSVYLADRVIPMLPEKLSNGICSLNAGEDRLTLSVIMEMNTEGIVENYRIVESVICVDERMSYPDVQRILELKGAATDSEIKETEDDDNRKRNKVSTDPDRLPEKKDSDDGSSCGRDELVTRQKGIHVGDSNRDTTMGDEELLTKYEDFIPMFCDMLELSLKIRARRKRRGAIDFDFPEAKILLDEKGVPTDVLIEKANDATRLIEDFMLTANETVAEEFCRREIPFVYRVHGDPDPEKIERVLEFVRRQDVKIEKKQQKITPKEIQQVLESVKGSPAEDMISFVILRAMQQAKYSPDCDGHFGLAAKYYCHFTSPIRRYPDLQIHRIIHDCIRGRMTSERIQHYKDILDEVAYQSSKTERRAAECERETEKLKKAEYMYERIGQEFEGRITSITGWGMFVELANTVEGLVRAMDMNEDYFHYNEREQCMEGELSGRKYRLGDCVKVIVKDADLRMHTVDFVLA